MKVTNFNPGGLPQAYATWSTGQVNEACEAESSSVSSNTLAIGGVIVSGSAASNYHILASGIGTAAWVPDTSGGSVSYGSNAMSVASANNGGVDTDVAREDHRHEGVHTVYANGSNGLVGDVSLQAGLGMALTTAGQVITFAALASGVRDAGRWELVVSGSGPPVAVTNPADDDFLYAWVP